MKNDDFSSFDVSSGIKIEQVESLTSKLLSIGRLHQNGKNTEKIQSWIDWKDLTPMKLEGSSTKTKEMQLEMQLDIESGAFAINAVAEV